MMPRTKKNTKTLKEEVFNVRCTTKQKATLEAIAAQEGLGLSSWLLRLGLVEARNRQTKEAQP